MRKIKSSIIAAHLLYLAVFGPLAESAEQGKYGIYSTTLENGMAVIAIEDHSLPITTIEIAVKNGAYTEPPEFDGLSHLYEHMFFKANSVIPGQERYMERLRELGAQWNGTTSDERVNYFMTVHKKNLWAGTEFLRDALLYPLFLDDELKRERPVVLGEFDRVEADPEFHLQREIMKRLWREHYSRKNTIGDRDVILTATREKMREIQSRYYVPNNSALFVAGDVNHAEVFDMARQLFGPWPSSGFNPHEKWPIPEHPPLKKTERIVVTGPVETATIMIEWHGPSMAKDVKSTFAADVLSFILAQPDSNFQKALVDSGLVDSIGISYYSLVHTGPISLTAVTSKDRLDKAWSAINEEMEKLNDKSYITEEQIESAKNMLEISEIYSREQISEFTHSLSFWWATGGLDYYLNYIDNLRAVSHDDLIAYAARYILGKPRIEGALVAEPALAEIEFDKGAEIIVPKFGTSQVAFEQTSAEEVTTEEFDVDGLRVVLRTNPNSEVVAAQMALLGGLAFYGKEKAGHELILLETLEKGSEKYSKDEIAKQLARTGATLGADARHDYSIYSLQTLRRDFEDNFAIFADVLARPTLDPTEVGLAIERRLSAVRMMQQQPDAYISILSSRNFYRGHPYEVAPTGTIESVEGLKPESIREFRKTLTRDRMTLFIVGNVTKEDAARLVKENFAILPAGKFERKIVQRTPAASPTLLIEERPLPTNYIFGAFDAPNLASEDYPAFQIAIDILSDRLFEEVRTKRNLSYAVASQLSQRAANYGVLYVTATKANDAVRVILGEVDRIISEPIPPKALEDKIEEMTTQILMSNQTNGAQAARLLLYEMNGGGWENEAGALDRLQDASPARVQEAAKKYLKSFYFSVLGDKSAIDEQIFTSR